MARPEKKKPADEWIQVDDAPSEKQAADLREWDRPGASRTAGEASPAAKRPSPPAPPAQQQVSPEERAVWADPVLSPWAPEPGKTGPSGPVAAPRGTSLGPATTFCPRCNARVTYARNGSPPWEATCPQCGAKGRFWK